MDRLSSIRISSTGISIGQFLSCLKGLWNNRKEELALHLMVCAHEAGHALLGYRLGYIPAFVAILEFRSPKYPMGIVSYNAGSMNVSVLLQQLWAGVLGEIILERTTYHTRSGMRGDLQQIREILVELYPNQTVGQRWAISRAHRKMAEAILRQNKDDLEKLADELFRKKLMINKQLINLLP